jgi:hypothetical protein
MTRKFQPRANAASPLAHVSASAHFPGRAIVLELVGGLRRVMGLHGDAVGNAEQAVRDNERARRHRLRVADETRAINDAYPTEPAFDVEQVRR